MKNRLKPTKDYSEVSFQYVCDECGQDHYFFLAELRIKNARVCYCGNIIEPEIISDINIVYAKSSHHEDEIEPTNDISIDTVRECVKTMCSLGYAEKEAESMIKQSFYEINTDDCSQLIKHSLKHFGASYA